MIGAAVLFSVITGVAMAFQSPTNAVLGRVVGTLQASLTNFAVGFALCVALVLTVGSGNILGVVGVEPWKLLGGAYGVFIIVCLVVATPKLGVVIMATMTMLGQLVAGMVVDGYGLLGCAVVEVSPLRVAGCVLVALGIFCEHLGSRTGWIGVDKTSKALAYMALPFAAGVVGVLQPPTNAALAASVGAFEATCVNFGVGLAILLVIVLVANRGHLKSYKGTHAWQMTGGAYGVLGVVLATVFSPALGMSLWMAGTMLGQLVGAAAIDSFGLLTLPKIGVNRYRIAGAAIIAAGVVVVAIAKLM